MSDAPLIITLLLDESSAAFFNELRKKYFPPERNFLSAHLTLFHHLPATEPTIITDLEHWSHEQSLLFLKITEVKSIGKGVAYKIENASLLQLHKKMQHKWNDWLTPQDKQRLWPHVTIQNKVAVAEARNTQAILQASFEPFIAKGTGFGLWSYQGGPWKALRVFPFNQG